MLPPLACLRINAPIGMPSGPPGKRAKPNEPNEREDREDRESEVPALPPELRELITELNLDDLVGPGVEGVNVGRLCKELSEECRKLGTGNCNDPNDAIWKNALLFFGLGPQDASYPQPPLRMTYRDLVYALCHAFAKKGGINFMVEGVQYELWEAVKLRLEEYLQVKRHGQFERSVGLINRVKADTFRRNLRAPNLGAITRETQDGRKSVGWYKGNGWYYPQNYKAALIAWTDWRRNNKELPPSNPLVVEEYKSYKRKCKALDRQLFLDLAVAMWERYRVGISDPEVFESWTVLMWLFAARSGRQFPMDQQGDMSQPPDAWYQQGPS